MDHVNKCRLFEAASCITYLAVAFEATTDDEVEEYDPLERSFEFARRTKALALQHQVSICYKKYYYRTSARFNLCIYIYIYIYIPSDIL